ncbi:hypothetical protein FRC15_009890 [Serendipita sp. 397]|nr:hypothetical protein FRC15_009890 [Serendipita sp. 397]KAG8802670.1 hypothetical protein FRC16_009023 [Serendipita sp. 398]
MVNWIIANTLSIWRTSPDTLEYRKEWLKQIKNRYPAIGLFDSSHPDFLIGFASAGPFRLGDGYNKTTECAIACGQEFTGKGFGRFLIQELLERLKRLEYHVVIAGISSSNPGSARFFAREGFTRTAFMPKIGEKNGVLLDLELWQLDLRATGNS